MKLKLSNTAYNIGKYIATVALPASGTLYAGLGALWGFPNVTEVVGTVGVVNTALGSLLLISTSQYNKDQQGDE